MARGKKKQAMLADPQLIEKKVVGSEPVWDTKRAEKMKPDEFDHFLRRSFAYYNHFYTPKTMRKYVTQWLTANKKLDKKQMAIYNKASDDLFPVTVGGLIRANSKGMPLKPRHIEYIMGKVNAAISGSAASNLKVAETEAPVAKKLSVQDHLQAQLTNHLAHFDSLEDQQFEGKNIAPDAFKYLTEKNVPQALIGKIVAGYTAHKDELVEAQKGKDPQLNEGYARFKPKDYKRILAFYSTLLADLEAYTHVKKVTRKARARKAPSKEKLVSKMKYLKDDTKLKIVSINPVDIVGATTLWVYNTKTRKLGAYVAESTAGTLGVRGSTILGFDEMKSVSKTLRKPEEQLAAFNKAGKVALRTFLTSIRAVETKMNGRINKDMVLLKVQ